MSQFLIIRLPAEPEQPVPWQLWPADASDRDDNGVLSSIDDLATLTVLHPDQKVIALAPAALVSVHSLSLAGKLTSAVLKSLPYRLEDELAEDVDDLHFAVLSQSAGQVQVAVVARRHMQFWHNAMQASGLNYERWIPEALALPWTEGECSAVQLDETWVLRTDQWRWTSCDDSWLALCLETLGLDSLAPEEGGLQVSSYSEIPEDVPGEWQRESAESPLKMLAAGAVGEKASLLQGEWRQESGVSRSLKPWRLAACLLLTTFALFAGHSIQQTVKLEQQANTLQDQARTIYSDLFPGERIIRLQSQMRQKLHALHSGATVDAGLLELLNDTAPMFRQHPQLEPVSLSYNHSIQALRLEARAEVFDTFTAFREAAGESMTVAIESLEQNGDMAVGTLVIRGEQP